MKTPEELDEIVKRAFEKVFEIGLRNPDREYDQGDYGVCMYEPDARNPNGCLIGYGFREVGLSLDKEGGALAYVEIPPAVDREYVEKLKDSLHGSMPYHEALSGALFARVFGESTLKDWDSQQAEKRRFLSGLDIKTLYRIACMTIAQSRQDRKLPWGIAIVDMYYVWKELTGEDLLDGFDREDPDVQIFLDEFHNLHPLVAI